MPRPRRDPRDSRYADGHAPGPEEDAGQRLDNDIGSWFADAGADIDDFFSQGGDGGPTDAEVEARTSGYDGESLGNEEYARERRARADAGLSDWDRMNADIPVIGNRGALDAANAAAEADINRNYWENLITHNPSVDTLTADYDEERYLGGLGSEWANESAEAARGRGAMEDALASMEGWARGGFTEADRAMMDENRRREAMGARADREASLSALEARGMGGGGGALASMLSANEAAASRGASSDTSMLAAAQNRQMQATRDAAALGGSMRDADARRTAGLEDYNNREIDYARGLEGRNVGTRNREEDSRIAAENQHYGNREAATSGITNQYSADVGARANAAAARAAADQNQAGFIGEIIDSL